VSPRNCRHGMGTAHGRAVGPGAPGAPASQAQPEGRPASGGRSAVLRGHSVDPLDGGAVERAAPAVWQLDDVLAPPEAVGRERGAAGPLAEAAEDAQRPPEAAMERVLHRRQLCPGEKRGAKIGPTKRGKGTKWMVLVDGAGTPLGAYLDSASPAEVTLLHKTLASMPVKGRPQRLIADRGYDSNGLRRELKRRRIQPIIPALRNHPNATDQDGRCLRRYRRRWIVERTIGWLGNFRRLTVRYDRLMATYGGFFHLACALIVLRRVVK
jgi:transposase